MKAMLTKVTLGEVDAGIVYVTDVQAAGDKVKGIEIPADVNASTTYPIATLTGLGEPGDGAGVRRLRPLAGRRGGADRGRASASP